MRFCGVVLAIVMLTGACADTGSLAAGKVESAAGITQEIVQREHIWSAGLIAHDPDAVASVIADDYIGIDGRGVVSDKAAEVDEARQSDSPGGATTLREELSEVRVRMYGAMAILTAINTEYVTLRGVESSTRFRRTTVWVQRNGRWQCASFHGSRIQTPSAVR
jgi:ketosteroid isomerase-like protein